MNMIKRIAIIFAATLSAIATLNVFSGTLWEPIRLAVQINAPAGVVGETIKLPLPMLIWLVVAAIFAALAWWLDNRFNREKAEQS